MNFFGFIILWTFTELWRTISLQSDEFCFQQLSQPQFFLINWGSKNLHSDQAQNGETCLAACGAHQPHSSHTSSSHPHQLLVLMKNIHLDSHAQHVVLGQLLRSKWEQ